MNHLGTVMPAEAKDLLSGSLHNLDRKQGTTVILTIVGLVLALWSTTGAMSGYMTAVNMVFDRKDRRELREEAAYRAGTGRLHGRRVPARRDLPDLRPADRALRRGRRRVRARTGYVWWIAQWPVLICGLLAAFGTVLYLGPDVDERHWRFLTLGAGTAAAVWLVISGAFAFYTARFGSYNKTWGSLAAVIIMLVWLWLSALALLFGAEVEAEFERSRAREPL